jgi:hypothetical protein
LRVEPWPDDGKTHGSHDNQFGCDYFATHS